MRLQEDAQVRDIVGWKGWITKNIPPSVDPSQITVEAQFDAGSTVLLVAVPMVLICQQPSSRRGLKRLSNITASVFRKSGTYISEHQIQSRAYSMLMPSHPAIYSRIYVAILDWQDLAQLLTISAQVLLRQRLHLIADS
jgi:hypothetical protein